MRMFNALTNFVLSLPLLFQTADGGAGSGGAAAGGGGAPGAGDASSSGGRSAGGAAAAGSRGAADAAGAAGAGAGGGEAQPFEFSDTARIRTADGRILTGAQYRAEIAQQLDGEYRGRYDKGFQLLLKEAQRIDQIARGGARGRQPAASAADDPLADIRNMAVVDGPTAARLVTMLQQQGLGPIANVVAALQRQTQELRQSLQSVSQRFGSQDEDAAARGFETRLDDVLAKVEVKGLNGKLNPRSEPLRELARNLYLSYQPSSWRTGEFEKMLGEQLSAVVAYVREMDRTHVSESRENLRRNFNPARGGASPSGDARFDWKQNTPRAIAARAAAAGMFSGPQT